MRLLRLVLTVIGDRFRWFGALTDPDRDTIVRSVLDNGFPGRAMDRSAVSTAAAVPAGPNTVVIKKVHRPVLAAEAKALPPNWFELGGSTSDGSWRGGPDAVGQLGLEQIQNRGPSSDGRPVGVNTASAGVRRSPADAVLRSSGFGVPVPGRGKRGGLP